MPSEATTLASKQMRPSLLGRFLQLSVVLAALVLIAPAFAVRVDSTAIPELSVPTTESVRQRLDALALPWVPNAGQWDARAAWRAQSFAGSVWVTQDGTLVHAFTGPRAAQCETDRGEAQLHPRRFAERHCPRAGGWVLTERFVSGRDGAIVGREPLEGRVSYFVGDESRHAPDLPAYSALDLGEVFPGVQVQLRATQANVEKLYTVTPGRDPGVIRMRLEGTPRLVLTRDGALEAQTTHGPIRFTAPVAFQFDARNERRDVPVRYALRPNACGERCHEYGFVLGHYDRSRPLTIDPLLQSTFLGGSGSDYATALAIHPTTGEVYVAGYTDSTPFPGTVGGAQAASGGGNDAFVSRFNAALTVRHQSTYIGDSGDDRAYALAIHPVNGDVYVAGETGSTSFPGTAGGAQAAYGGGSRDAFVSRFNAALTVRHQSTFLGGAGNDHAQALAIHPARGEIYVAGYTYSADFPGTSGGAQAAMSSGPDAFVTRFNATLTVRHQSTYSGAAGLDYGTALAVHPLSGEVYVAGGTSSTAYPDTAGGAQATYGGGLSDAFLSRFNAALTERLQSTFFGGSGRDYANALAIHPASGEVYVAGWTTSPDLPGASGGAQTTSGGGRDAFVSRFNAALTALPQSSYIGGGGSDDANALAIHPASGEVYVAGDTASTFLPGTVGGALPTYGGGLADAFVSRFNAMLTVWQQSTFVGGAGDDRIAAMAIHPASGEVIVAGSSNSIALPGTAGGAQAASGGGVDAFVSRLSLDLMAADVVPDAFVLPAQLGVRVSSTRTAGPVQIGGLGALAPITIDGALGSAVCVSSTNACTCDVSGGSFVPTANIANNQYLCVRHVSAPTVGTYSESRVVVGGFATKFVTLTGNLAACNLDMDNDGQVTASKEGLVIARALLGFTPASAVVGTGITQAQWDAKRAGLAACGIEF